jgi:hypothetical protein
MARHEEREFTLGSIPCFTRAIHAKLLTLDLPFLSGLEPITTPTHPPRHRPRLHLPNFRQSPTHAVPIISTSSLYLTRLSHSLHLSKPSWLMASYQVPHTRLLLYRITQIHQVRWPSGLRRQLKVISFVVHQYNRWSERAWVQIPLSST